VGLVVGGRVFIFHDLFLLGLGCSQFVWLFACYLLFVEVDIL
jgi:hypothetical protein